MYGLSSLTKLDDLLGERWYIRGSNEAGDFCYVQSHTVRFYLKAPKQKLDYKLQQDGTIKIQNYGIKHRLVFKFVRSDGTVAEWSKLRGINLFIYFIYLRTYIYNFQYIIPDYQEGFLVQELVVNLQFILNYGFSIRRVVLYFGCSKFMVTFIYVYQSAHAKYW